MLNRAFLDENGKVAGIIDNVTEHMGKAGLPSELIRKNGADILHCGEIGPRAIDLCQELGIESYSGHAD